ncbi:MAG TPA: acetyl-CoA hydrolase/transferase C-terminal domain-containing protein [Candidatus Binataceae bacterium]|nr:acetyl-CoA hydrolase/transferase C-terminal domain-containing protein [Candidatus Binataceae bacterium]
MTTEIELRNLDFAKIIRPGDHIVWGQGSGEPVTLVERLVEQRHAIGPVSVFLGGTCYSNTLRPEHADVITFSGFGAIGSLRRMAAAGALQLIPCHLSQAPGYFLDGTIGSDVVFLHLSGPDERGQYSYSLANDYLQFAMARARVVIAEVNELAPWTYFDGRLDSSRIDYIVRVSRPVMEIQPASFGPVEEAIAGHIARFIEDGTTIQMGIGAIPDAVLAGVSDRRDLGIHSGLIGDRVADLMESGIVTNARKPIDTGFTVAGTLRGTKRLYDFAHRNRAIRLFTLMHTHRAEILSQLGKVVAVNSAVEVDLTGQVNAEVAAGVYVGAVGGQGDFVRGVQMASRGRSAIALPATARDGQVSRIVARLGGPVTTARSDADLIVTEFGVADLRGQPLDARIPRMIAISDPKFREALEREAHQMTRRSAPAPG